MKVSSNHSAQGIKFLSVSLWEMLSVSQNNKKQTL